MRPANERRRYIVTSSHWLGAYTKQSQNMCCFCMKITSLIRSQFCTCHGSGWGRGMISWHTHSPPPPHRQHTPPPPPPPTGLLSSTFHCPMFLCVVSSFSLIFNSHISNLEAIFRQVFGVILIHWWLLNKYEAYKYEPLRNQPRACWWPGTISCWHIDDLAWVPYTSGTGTRRV